MKIINASWEERNLGVTCCEVTIGANGQLYFHKKYRNKSFSIILIITSIMTLIMGFVGITNISFVYMVVIITLANIIIKLLQGIHRSFVF